MQALLRRILTRSFLGLALFAFLLPFVTMSCGQAKLLTMNGFQMAAGADFKPDHGGGLMQRAPQKVQKIDSNSGAAIAIVVTALALGCAFLGGKQGRVLPAGGAGIAVLSMLALKFQLESDIAKIIRESGVALPLTAEWEMGYWLAILAMIAACVFACLPERQAEAATAGTPNEGVPTPLQAGVPPLPDPSVIPPLSPRE